MAGVAWFGRRTTVVGAGVLLALVGGGLGAPAHAGPRVVAAAPVECPQAYPLSTVTAGLVGEGRTVVTGDTPQPFRVEVLGVLQDGLGAGRDLIMVKISDLPGGDVVSQGGGIWEGMSGSPVYVGNQLLGSVSYGFTYGPSPIGALTPASELLDLLGPSGARAARADRAPAKEVVTLSASARRELGVKAGTAAPRGSLQSLPTPLAVSGLGAKRLAQVQKNADAAGLALSVHSGAGVSASAAAAPALRPVAGGNFASVLGTGDAAAYGWGTTTAVCGNRAVAYGHPFESGPAGPVSYGANAASSLGIVSDGVSAPFKMVNVRGAFGTVDQDRIGGTRVDLTRTAPGTHVTTVIRDLDDGKRRVGTSEILAQPYLPDLVATAVYANQDRVFDEWADGTARSGWTIKGTRAGGKPFSVTRNNRWASHGDVTVGPANDVARAADQLANNQFEDVDIDSISFNSSMATTFQQLHISKVQVKVGGAKTFTTPKSLKVKVGTKLTVKVSLSPYHSTRATTVTYALTVPKSARGQSGSLVTTGGADLGSGDDFEDIDCLLFGECASAADGSSLDAIIKGIETAPKNNRVLSELQFESDDDDEVRVAASAGSTQKLTVTGERDIPIRVAR